MTEDNVTRRSAASMIAEKYLGQTTAKQKLLLNAFQAPDSRYQPICRFLTLKECALNQKEGKGIEVNIDDACDDVHFEPIICPQTDINLGHCSYLNTCHRTSRCKYLHFNPVRRPNAPPFKWQTIYDDDPMPIRRIQPAIIPTESGGVEGNVYGNTQLSLEEDEQKFVEALIRHPSRSLHEDGLEEWSRNTNHSPELTPAQWIDADLKSFDYSMLGKFDVIVADPPWDIHMSLPYGTMSDDDMRAMPFPQLQDEGFLFLWVTGRAMELGRELLSYWGYTRTDEIIWVKVGQTQRLIRTGRTGHWLNHTKEHCLVGVKVKDDKRDSKSPTVSTLSPPSTVTYPASHAPGIPNTKLLPSWANAGLDADVIVAEVRDTSRKPDELYNIIERLCPKGRKIELFGRRHNARPGWITVGNQLKGDHIVDTELKQNVAAWREKNARY